MESEEQVKNEREAALSLAALMTQNSNIEAPSLNEFDNAFSELRKVMLDAVTNYSVVLTMDNNVIELYNTFKCYWRVKADTARPSSSSSATIDAIANKVKTNLALTKKIEADLGTTALQPYSNQNIWLPMAKQRDEYRKITMLAFKEFQELLKILPSPQLESLEKRLLDLCNIIKSQKKEVLSSSQSTSTSNNPVFDFPLINTNSKQPSTEMLANELFPSTSDAWSAELQQELANIESSRSKDLNEKMKKLKEAIKDFIGCTLEYTKQIHQIHESKCEPHVIILIDRVEAAINERRKAEKLSHWFSDLEYQTLEKENEMYARRLQIEKQLEMISINSEKIKSIVNKTQKLKAESDPTKINAQDLNIENRKSELLKELMLCKEEEDRILSNVINLSKKRVALRPFALGNDPMMPKRSQSAGVSMHGSMPLTPGSSSSSTMSSSSLIGPTPGFLSNATLHPFEFDFPEMPVYTLVVAQCNKNINGDLNYIQHRLAEAGIGRYPLPMPTTIHHTQLLQQQQPSLPPIT